MTRYSELVDLAYSAATRDVAAVLWSMAKEYQAEAGEFGNPPDIGDPPSRIGERLS